MDVTIARVMLARKKRLRGGKVITVIKKNKAVVKCTGYDQDGDTVLQASATNRQFCATLRVYVDTNVGSAEANVVSQDMTGYLKKKKFEIVGYGLDARITNTTHREQY